MLPHLHDPTQNEKLDPAVLRDDTTFAAGRIAFFQYVIVAVFLFILSGFWNLQVQENEIYTEAADRNLSWLRERAAGTGVDRARTWGSLQGS